MACPVVKSRDALMEVHLVLCLFFIVHVAMVCVCVGMEVFALGILSSVLHIMKFHFVM